MEYRKVKVVNIFLGIICLSVESYVYRESIILARIDQIYLTVVSFCLFESIMSMLICANNHPVNSAWRFICSFTLLGTGGLLIYSAVDIEASDTCSNYRYIFGNCHKYEYKISAGLLAMINGLFYLLAKSQAQTILGTVHNIPVSSIPSTNPSMHQQPPPPYSFPNNYAPYDNAPPPPYQSVIQNTNTNSNNVNNNPFSFHGQQTEQQPQSQGQVGQGFENNTILSPPPGWK